MASTTTLPETGFVRIQTVLAHLPIGRSTFWAGVKTGVYPPAYKLSAGVTAWKAEDIRLLLKKLGGAECPPPSSNSAGVSANVQPSANTQRQAKKRVQI